MLGDIFKNPIIIGLIFGAIVYVYLLKQKWDAEKKKNKKIKVEDPNILIPVGVAILVGCFVWYYWGSSQPVIPNNNMTVESLAKEPLQNEDVIESLTGQSNNSVSFHLVGKGINMPNNLPDVFLDMDGFDN
jgi:hypothetical protein